MSGRWAVFIMGKARQVIIGNSAAALSAVKGIRRFDSSCPVTMISADNCLAYSPVLLPYYIGGKIGRDGLFVVGADFYQRNGVKLILGNEVVNVDTKKQMVQLKDGSLLEYDNLLIASGGSPEKLNSFGEHMSRVMTLRTIDDAQRILEVSKSAKDILISGAGLASLEVANALRRQDRRVTVMAKSKQILSRNADAECANIIQAEIEKSGVSFVLGRDVTEIAPFKDKIRVLTDMDDKMTVDMVIVGKGVSPNIHFLRDKRVNIDRGILVNEKMETNIASIYASGDVAQSKSLLTNDHRVFANWPSACIEGEVAGLNMVGHVTSLPGEVGYNVLPIFNRTVAFLGETKANSPAVEIVKYLDEKKSIYRKFILRDNRIIGAILLEAFQDVGIVLNLITRCVDVSRRKDELANNRFSWGKVLHDMS
jgi:nitrite reductase (NADH) large subunit